MTLTSGFFNSINHDRTYTNEEMAMFLDGIVYDGVYEAVGNKFFVSETSPKSMSVMVDPGRAWFDHTWTLNTTKINLEIEAADTVYNRYDAVVIEVNKEERENFIKVITGTPAAVPEKPELVKTDLIKQYALAYIIVYKDEEYVSQENIEYVVDTSETPLCSALALAGIPSGGETGYVLAKSSSESGAVGWYPPESLPYDDWMYVAGITKEEVIAAWKFKGAESEAVALTTCNILESSYALAKTGDDVTWSQADGIFIPGGRGQKGLINADVKALSMGTVVVKYANAETGNNWVGLFDKDQRTVLCAKMAYRYTWDPDSGNVTTVYAKRPGMKFDPTAAVNYGYSNHLYFTYTIEEEPRSGVISYNVIGDEPIMFFNKEKCALSRDPTFVSAAGGNSTYKTIPGYESGDVLIGHNAGIGSGTSDDMFGSVYVHAVIVFNRILTDREVIRVHEAMMAL